jgi:hypothetical protein
VHPLSFLLSCLLCATAGLTQAVPVGPDTCARAKVLVTVVDSDGTPDLRLTAANFRAESKGFVFKVAAAKLQKTPPRAMLILDFSSSMRTAPGKWRVVEAVSLGLVEAASRADPLAFVTFDENVINSFGFSTPKEMLTEAIEQLKGHADRKLRRTALFDAVYSTIDSFGSPQPGDTIFLVTDGGDNRSRRTLPEIQNLLVQKQVRVFTALFVDGAPPTPEELRGREVGDLVASHWRAGGEAWSSSSRRGWCLGRIG